MKLVSLLLLLLILVPIAEARIVIDVLDEDRYNIGDVVELTGYVIEDTSAQVPMRVNLICGEESKAVYYSVVNVKAGEKLPFELDVPVADLDVTQSVNKSCLYNVVLDLPNEVSAQNSNEFLVSNELIVKADLDYTHRKPGETINVIGRARKINGEILEKGSVAVSLFGNQYNTEVVKGEFKREIILPKGITSGGKAVTINVRDNYGNEGKDILSLYVDAIPSLLTISLEKESVKPGEIINLVPNLYDQAGDPSRREAVLSLNDADGDLRYKKVVETGVAHGIALDEFAIPGNWRLSVLGENGLFDDAVVYVEEVKATEMKLENGILYVTNVGNVEYVDPLEINLEGGGNTYTVIEKTSIMPNQTIAIDVSKEVPSGDYNVKVAGFPAVTGNVLLEGRSSGTSSIAGFVAIGFAVLFLIYMMFSRAGRRGPSRREVARTEGQRMLGRSEVQKQEYGKPTKEDVDYALKKYKYKKPEYGKATQEDVDYVIQKVKRDNEEFRRGGMFNY
jgi:hypothetical protein